MRSSTTRASSVARTVAVMAIAMLMCACGGAQSRLANHMQRGQVYFADGNYGKASVEFRNALQIAPKDPVARIMAGRSAEKLGRIRDAVGLYQSVVDDTPDNVDARANLGRLMIFGGAAQRGLTVIQPALDKHPDNAELLTLRAAARLRLNNQAGALADTERALALDPANEDAVALRAGFYRDAGDIAAAETLVSNAVRQHPGSVALREVLVRLCAASKEPAKVEEQLRALIGLEPQVVGYRDELAALYVSEQRVDDAQRLMEESVKQVPGDDTKLMLVRFIASQRSLTAGEHMLQGFVDQAPDDHDLRLALGDLLLRGDSTKEAIAAYNEVVRRDDTGPKGLMARDRLAAVATSQHRYGDALELVDQVLKKNPLDTGALSLRGEMRLEQGKPADAIEDFRAVLHDQPKNVSVQRLLAAAYAANGNSALAQQSLRTAIDLMPSESTLRIELAKLLVQDRKAGQAVTLMEENVRVAPQDETVRAELVRADLANGDLEAAHKAADDLITLRPDSAVALFLAGVVSRARNQLDDAQKYFERALAVEPRAFDALEALATMQLARGRDEQAFTLVKQAVEREPKNPLPLDLLGSLYLSKKNLPAAIDALTRATELAPNWPVAYRNLALADFAANDVPRGVKAYEAAINTAPDQPELVVELAHHYEGLGRIDEAIEAYETWHRGKPEVRIVSNNLAILLVTYKTDRASLDLARDLTTAFANSSDGSFLDTNGWVRFKRGEYNEALPVLQRAAELEPGNAEVRYHLGMAELHAGEDERARSDLQTAVAGAAKFPGSDDARRVLAGLSPTRS